MTLNPALVQKFGKALADTDKGRVYPRNAAGVSGAIVREGVVTAQPGAVVVMVSIGGGAPVPIRYLGSSPANGAKVLVIVFGQITYCVGVTSDSTTAASSVKAEGYRSLTQAVATNTLTGVVFNTLTTDPLSMLANTGAIIVPVAGDYLIASGITWLFSSPPSGSSFYISVMKNGSEFKRAEQASWTTGDTLTPGMLISLVAFDCVPLDFFQIGVFQTTGAGQNLFIGGPVFNWFQAKRLN